MDKLISVVVPVYNSGGLISECLNSLLAQDYHNFEVIIINDGSSDNTADIVKLFIKSYGHNQFHSYINEINLGLGHTLHRGFELAKGEFVVILHHDDYLPPSYLSSISNFLKVHDAIVFTSYSLVDKNGILINNSRNIDYIKYFIPRLYLCISSISTIGIAVNRKIALDSEVFKRNSHVIGQNENLIRTYDEWRTWVELSYYGSVRHHKSVKAFYRQHGNNMRDKMALIGDFDHRQMEIITILKAHKILKRRYGTIIYYLFFLPIIHFIRSYNKIKGVE